MWESLIQSKRLNQNNVKHLNTQLFITKFHQLKLNLKRQRKLSNRVTRNLIGYQQQLKTKKAPSTSKVTKTTSKRTSSTVTKKKSTKPSVKTSIKTTTKSKAKPTSTVKVKSKSTYSQPKRITTINHLNVGHPMYQVGITCVISVKRQKNQALMMLLKS